MSGACGRMREHGEVGMSDARVPSDLSEKPLPEGRAQEGAVLPAVASASPPVIQFEPGPGTGQQAPPDLEFENLQALSRFLIGVLLEGGEELFEILRSSQRGIEADPGLLVRGASQDQETTLDLARYMAVGLYARGQKRVARGVRDGFYFSVGAASWFLGGVNRLSDNRLTRPLRRSVAKRARRLGEEAALVVDEGRREEQKARLLAGQTVGDIIDEFLEYFATNPDVADEIRALIGQQSVGLASIAGDNARQLAVIGDNLSEAIVRRLLFRKPRRELPPSPLLGKPQTMYSPDTVAERGKGDGQ